MLPSSFESTYAVRYLVMGALFGLAFPVFASLFLLMYEQLPFSWASVLALHASRPLLLVIDTAPVFLGLFASVAGMKQDTVQEYTESLQAANRKLAQEITQKEALAQRFEQEKLRAEEAAEAKSQFLSIMSHEIRMPIDAVIGMSQCLLEDHPRPAQVEDMKTLKCTAEGVRVLVSDMLDFSKIETATIRLEQTPFNLRQLVTNLQRSLAPQVQKKGILLETHFDEAVPATLLGDPVRIGQIILTLISNAIKYTEEGRVSVSLSLQETVEDQATIRCAVLDSGSGLSAAQRERSVNGFSSATSSHSPQQGGSELGLVITRKLLECYHSRLMVKSAVGGGATFSFLLTLPVVSAAPVEEEKTHPLKNAAILLVEDNAVNVLIARKLLEPWSVKLDVATNGQLAVDQVQNNDYDLVLMDLQMPIMDGYQAAQRIRQLPDPRKQAVPIIALTASVMAEERERALAVGMNDYLTKPIDIHRLGEKMAQQVI